MNDAILSTAISTEDQFTSGAYTKRPLTLVRGQGCTVWDDEGRPYLDLTSGQGVALLGHAHPAITAAISAQASTLITCAEAFYNDRRAEIVLDERIADETPLARLCSGRVVCRHPEPALAKALAQWNFNPLDEAETEWTGVVAAADRLRFLGTVSRYVSVVRHVSLEEDVEDGAENGIHARVEKSAEEGVA